MPAVALVSVIVANAACTTPSPPLRIRLVALPPIVRPAAAVADSTPVVSLRVTVKVSGAPVLPVSDRTIVPRLASLPTPIVCAPGDASTGVPFTVTAICDGPAEPPRLSVALTVIVSDAVVALVSVNVVRSAFTCASVPLIVSVLPPPEATTEPPPPTAPVFPASTPLVSVSTAVKVSPIAVGDSARLITTTGLLWPSPTVVVAGAEMLKAPEAGVTLTAIDFGGAAALPKLSVAVTVIVSADVPASRLASVARSAFTCASVPPIVRLCEPLPLTPVPLADSAPAVSVTTTMKVSPLVVVLPVSDTLTPDTAVETPCATVADAGAAIEGVPFTVTATVCVPAVLPNPSVALTVRLSVPGVPLVSPRLASAVLTWVKVPVKLALVVPPPLTLAPPALLVVSRP